MTGEEMIAAATAMGHILRRRAMNLTRNPIEAEDLVQQTLVFAFEGAAKYDPAAGRLAAWLMVVMKNAFINNVRRKKRERSNVALDAYATSDDFHTFNRPEETQKSRAEDPPVQVATAESIDFLLTAVQHLPDHHRAVMELHLDRLSDGEIGERLGIPTPTVRTRLWRARRALLIAVEQGILPTTQRRTRCGPAPVGHYSSRAAFSAPDRAA